MKNYEVIAVLTPQISDAEAGEFIGTIKKLISGKGGEVLSEDWLGRRKFFHPISKKRDGFYIYLKLKAEPQMVYEIRRALHLQEKILRVEIIAAEETVQKK